MLISAPVAATGQAGGVLLTETARATGLDTALSTALTRWRKPLAVHDPGKILLDLVISLALGGEALSDIDALRAEPELYGLVASDPTVSPPISTLAADEVHAVRAPGSGPVSSTPAGVGTCRLMHLITGAQLMIRWSSISMPH